MIDKTDVLGGVKMKISQILGAKIVLGERECYVTSVLRINERIVQLKCVGASERAFFINFDGVRFDGETLWGGEVATENKSAQKIRLGKPCFLANGKFLGRIDDLLFSGQKISHFIIARKKRPFANFCEKDAIIFDEIVAKNPRKRTIKPLSLPHIDGRIEILDENYIKGVLTKL